MQQIEMHIECTWILMQMYECGTSKYLFFKHCGALKCQNEDGKISKSVHSNCCLSIMVGHIHLFDGFAPCMLPYCTFET